MVKRVSKTRKYFGSRTWGGGNKKNRRGSGARGGVGRAGKKHKMTQIVVYDKDRFHKKGFVPFKRSRLLEISLGQIAASAAASKEGDKPVVELSGYKVLSNGVLSKPLVIKATRFSGKAMEKIKAAGGEAVKL